MRPGRFCEGFEESGFSKLFLIPWTKKWNGWSGIICSASVRALS